MRRRKPETPVGPVIEELAIVTVRTPLRAVFQGNVLISEAVDLDAAVGSPRGLAHFARIGCGARFVATEARLATDHVELVLRLDFAAAGNGQATLVSAADEAKSLRHSLLASTSAAAAWAEQPEGAVEDAIWKLVDATEDLVSSLHGDAKVFIGEHEVDLRRIRNGQGQPAHVGRVDKRFLRGVSGRSGKNTSFVRRSRGEGSRSPGSESRLCL